MENVLTEVCDYLNNYFWEKKIKGHFVISGGILNVSGVKNGQYFRILGSTFNNGIHQYPITEDNKLIDEEFDGYIWALAIPQTVLAIAEDIGKWQNEYGSGDSAAMSPFNSESFNNYSYSKNGNENANSGSNVTWQDVFSGRLNKYRKLRGCR